MLPCIGGMRDGGPEEERAGTPYGEAEHMDGHRQAGFTIAPGNFHGLLAKKGLAHTRWIDLGRTNEAKISLRSIADNIMNVHTIQVRTEHDYIQIKHESNFIIKSGHWLTSVHLSDNIFHCCADCSFQVHFIKTSSIAESHLKDDGIAWVAFLILLLIFEPPACHTLSGGQIPLVSVSAHAYCIPCLSLGSHQAIKYPNYMVWQGGGRPERSFKTQKQGPEQEYNMFHDCYNPPGAVKSSMPLCHV